MSLTARFLVFIGVPLLFGVAGLGASFLQTKSLPNHEVDFNRDFVVPYILVTILVVVIGFRTGGFKGQRGVVVRQDEGAKDGHGDKGKKEKKKNQ